MQWLESWIIPEVLSSRYMYMYICVFSLLPTNDPSHQPRIVIPPTLTPAVLWGTEHGLGSGLSLIRLLTTICNDEELMRRPLTPHLQIDWRSPLWLTDAYRCHVGHSTEVAWTEVNFLHNCPGIVMLWLLSQSQVVGQLQINPIHDGSDKLI